MIAKILKPTLIVLLSGLALTSCKKDFLERVPPTALSFEEALKTEGDLQVAL